MTRAQPTARARPTAPTRVLIVDDLALQREGYRQIVDSQSDMTVVGEASNALEAGRFVRGTVTDVVLMDVHLPGVDGLVATKRLVSGKRAGLLGANPRVVLVTALGGETMDAAARDAGASSLLLKEAEPEILLAAIRSAAQNSA